MVYNFNLGIGWASSGVEYAQAYRAKILRKARIPARFVFTDMFPMDNIEHMTRNIGFLDKEVIWLYTFFTDTKIAPVSFTLSDLQQMIFSTDYKYSREGKIGKIIFEGNGNFYTVYFTNETDDLVHRVEMVQNGKLIRKDYYTYCRIYSEYYAPLDGKAHLYERRFFNEDGSVAYEEIIDDDAVMYEFPDRFLYSKTELVAYLVQRLHLTEKDVVIVDRTTDIGQPVMQNATPARLGIVIHADHFCEGSTDENNILWNNYYEYDFAMSRHIDFYLSSTQVQSDLVRKQAKRYMNVDLNCVTIPVGSLQKLRRPKGKRRVHALITASRLAGEKHVDWLVDAVVAARNTVKDVSLDIYGKGPEEDALKKQIEKSGAQEYIRLMGQQDLTKVYVDYEGYLSGSTSEGFGLTLMEAVGSGLPIIGFDVRYGNPTFIDDGQNGYLLAADEETTRAQRVKMLSDAIIELFTHADLCAYSEHSYDVAKEYLNEAVEEKWINLLCC